MSGPPQEATVDSTEGSPQQRGVKRPSDAEVDVHSANEWENANLGDTDRKQKFLRLMGASKTEHHGKIVIGEATPTSSRQLSDADKLTEGLEDQYSQSLEHKLSGGARQHAGLGFHSQDAPDSSKPQAPAEVSTSEENGKVSEQPEEEAKKDEEKEGQEAVKDEGGGSISSSSSSSSSSQKDDENKDKICTQNPKKKMMMNFVKSSS